MPRGKICLLRRKKIYLATPMEQAEYVRIKIEDIPQEFIEEYNLMPMVHNGWVYFEIVKG